jgi:hypothetical protein
VSRVKTEVNFSDIVGKCIRRVYAKTQDNPIEYLVFECTDGTEYHMYHEQDCCEYVYLNDITEGYQDILTNATVLDAYASSNREDDPDTYGTHTWTFYRLVTDKGVVVLRWYGSSNGYYSEDVSFYIRPTPSEE